MCLAELVEDGYAYRPHTHISNIPLRLVPPLGRERPFFNIDVLRLS